MSADALPSAPRCLVVELWGLGDATIMTSLLQGLLARGWHVTVLAKPASRALLAPTYPAVEWIELDAPWTAFRGKYRLWAWPWRRLASVLRRLWAGRFDAAVSVRKDPRDAGLMALAGIPRRLGFATRLGRPFLTDALPSDPRAHRVDDWWALLDRLTGGTAPRLPPRLAAEPERKARFAALLRRPGEPLLAVHCGARIAVRRWPEASFRALLAALRGESRFRLALFPDPDGYGAGLADLADETLARIGLPDLVAALACADALVCNDSGPAHIAAALGVPVLALFGPTAPEWFRPFGEAHHVVIRDICAYRPCLDACRFPEPYCLTRLTPEEAWPEARDFWRKIAPPRLA